MNRLNEAVATSIITGDTDAMHPGHWQPVGDLGLGELAWAHTSRPEAIVHRVTLLGYEPQSRHELDDIATYCALERMAEREIRLLGTVLHHTITHHDLRDRTLTTLWAEAWPNHNLHANEDEDDTHDTSEVEDWHYDYLDQNLTPTGAMPTVASTLWRRARLALSRIS